MKVYYTNSRSVRNKIDLLRATVCTENIDIIAITESWLDMSEKILLPEIQIQGYNIFHKDRVGRKGGGVVLYARDTLQCCINKSVKTNNNTESIWIDIKEIRENFFDRPNIQTAKF